MTKEELLNQRWQAMMQSQQPLPGSAEVGAAPAPEKSLWDVLKPSPANLRQVGGGLFKDLAAMPAIAAKGVNKQLRELLVPAPNAVPPTITAPALAVDKK